MVGEKAVRIAEERVSVNRDQVWVDSWSFEALVDEMEREPDPAKGEAMLVRALKLYQAELLAGEDQAWVVAARERLRARFLRGVRKAAEARAAREDWRGALEWYQRGLEVDELIEEFHQGALGAYAALGYRAEAIAAYRRCQRTLSRLLGIAPCPAIQNQYRALLAD